MRAFIVCFFWLVCVFIGRGESPTTLTPIVTWSGIDSNCDKFGVERCHSVAEWEAVWKKHRGVETPQSTRPEIDFVSYMVIAIFDGQSSQNYGLTIAEIVNGEKSIRVRFRPHWYQIAGLPMSEADDLKLRTQSFVFVVLPTSEKSIVIEDDVKDNSRALPKWRIRKTVDRRK